MARKPAIQARQGHARGLDDIGKGIVKGAEKAKLLVEYGKFKHGYRKIERQAVKDYKAGFEQDIADKAIAKAALARKGKKGAR